MQPSRRGIEVICAVASSDGRSWSSEALAWASWATTYLDLATAEQLAARSTAAAAGDRDQAYARWATGWVHAYRRNEAAALGCLNEVIAYAQDAAEPWLEASAWQARGLARERTADAFRDWQHAAIRFVSAGDMMHASNVRYMLAHRAVEAQERLVEYRPGCANAGHTRPATATDTSLPTSTGSPQFMSGRKGSWAPRASYSTAPCPCSARPAISDALPERCWNWPTITGPASQQPGSTCCCKGWGRRCSRADLCARRSWSASLPRPPKPEPAAGGPRSRRARCSRPAAGPGRHRRCAGGPFRGPGRRPPRPRLRGLRGGRPGDQPDPRAVPTVSRNCLLSSCAPLAVTDTRSISRVSAPTMRVLYRQSDRESRSQADA